jgi:hypothetical protein
MWNTNSNGSYVDRLQAEIVKTRSTIETIEQDLNRLSKDHSVNLGILIEKNRAAKELSAYLSGLEFRNRRITAGDKSE